MSSNPYLVQPQIQYTPGKGDPYASRLCDWIQYGEKEADLSLIGVPLSKSSISFSGAHAHPASFRQLWSSFQTYNWDDDIDLTALTAADMGDVSMHVTDVLQCHRNIGDASRFLWSRYPSTTGIFIGGDHSVTYPIVKGLSEATGKRIGLIQFDAHLDVRDTAYGGPSNGTPMRSLIEQGILQGENMINIGLRSFANSSFYRKYAEDKGIVLFSAKQAREMGMQRLTQWAMDYLQPKVDIVYLTFDIDVIDQVFVPGVPAMGPGGLVPQDLFDAAYALGKWDKVVGMDMVCVDPTRDLRDMTIRVALHVFLQLASGRIKRKSR